MLRLVPPKKLPPWYETKEPKKLPPKKFPSWHETEKPNAPRGFVATCRGEATRAWQAVPRIWGGLTETRQTMKQRPLKAKASTGCLGILMFGLPFMVPLFMLLITLATQAVVIAYALVMTVLW